MGLREPTGKPVEGRLVGVIPTKTSGWEKGGELISQEGGQHHSGLSHGMIVLLV